MTRLNAVLLLAVMLSAMALVRTAYEERRLFAELYRAQTEHRRLGLEQARLEADRQVQATTVQVDRTARQKLQMRPMTPAVMMFEDGAPASAPMPLSASSPLARRPEAAR